MNSLFDQLRAAHRSATTSSEISEHLPPMPRSALVAAAAAGDLKAIDLITDKLVRDYPSLVVPRNADRQQFQPRSRLATA